MNNADEISVQTQMAEIFIYITYMATLTKIVSTAEIFSVISPEILKNLCFYAQLRSFFPDPVN
jgi:hypothetical protein